MMSHTLTTHHMVAASVPILRMRTTTSHLITLNGIRRRPPCRSRRNSPTSRTTPPRHITLRHRHSTASHRPDRTSSRTCTWHAHLLLLHLTGPHPHIPPPPPHLAEKTSFSSVSAVWKLFSTDKAPPLPRRSLPQLGLTCRTRIVQKARRQTPMTSPALCTMSLSVSTESKPLSLRRVSNAPRLPSRRHRPLRAQRTVRGSRPATAARLPPARHQPQGRRPQRGRPLAIRTMTSTATAHRLPADRRASPGQPSPSISLVAMLQFPPFRAPR